MTDPRARTALNVGVAPPADPLGVDPGADSVVQAASAMPAHAASAIAARLTPNGANGDALMMRLPPP
ncbi:MAG TPA: hypothetical protein VF118_18150 [Gemmatimonadaceae bacterium]